MKKRKFKNLSLKKTSVANFSQQVSIKGGSATCPFATCHCQITVPCETVEIC